ncbi:MAG: cation-transporting P-type ATPase [Promethearchaeati archaeon SRVP18_Atabeyarchaeia-1]
MGADNSATATDEKAFQKKYAETCSLSLDELTKQLKTDLTKGLSQRDAEERLEKSGPNLIPKVKPSFYKIWIAPFMNLLITIYLIISTALALIAIFILPDAGARLFIWIPIIAINAILSIVQQARAQKKLEALQRLSAPQCEVVRDSKLAVISSDQLVPGDVIKLKQGDRVPADGRVITASALSVNEAILTGESEEVEKVESHAECDKDSPVYSWRNMTFLGTYVTAGSGSLLVLKTGKETQLGRISATLEQLDTGEIPLRQKINRLARYLGVAVVLYLVVSLTYGIYVLSQQGNLFVAGALDVRRVADDVVVSLVTAMSIMPINIPLLTTITLLTGILAMAKHQVLIRDLSAVEGLGRVSVICSDKTGTITKNEMTAEWVCTPRVKGPFPTYRVSGVGYQPSGRILEAESDADVKDPVKMKPGDPSQDTVDVKHETPLEYILASCILGNESSITHDKLKIGKVEHTVHKAVGNATDASLLVLFRKSKLDEKEYRSRFKELFSYPFDSRAKRITNVYKDDKTHKYVVLARGATEMLLPLCGRLAEKKMGETASLREDGRSAIEKHAYLYASSGYRVISFAIRQLDEPPSASKPEREQLEKDMTYLGFVAIMDAPREGVLESVQEARMAGIKPVMVTGDSLPTAKSIAQKVGIAEEGDNCIEGSKIDSLSNQEFLKTSVFARVSPEHKMMIVNRYKKQKRTVAMTGDGVNDALAISKADVGIATGITGTDVAKQAAGMIITDDSFTSIITGVREGRGLFQKIRAIVFFYIAVNFAEAMIYFGSSLFPGFHLLNSWQQIYIFATVHSIPPFAIIFGHISKDVMKEKPRDTEGIFTKRLGIALLLFSLSLALMLYVVYGACLNGIWAVFPENMLGYIPTVSWEQAKARTMLHSVIVISESLVVASLIQMNKPIDRTLVQENRLILPFFIILVPLAHIALMYNPALQSMLYHAIGLDLEIIQLNLLDWVAVVLLALFPVWILETYKKRVRNQGLFF